MRRAVTMFGSLLFLAAVSYFAMGFVSAGSRVHALCGSIAPGMQARDVALFAKSHGLGPPPASTGISFLVEKRTFGRYGCRVTMENGVVLTSDYDASN